jgi:beta-lactamase class D
MQALHCNPIVHASRFMTPAILLERLFRRLRLLLPLSVTICVALAGCAATAHKTLQHGCTENPALAAAFGEIDGTFVLLDAHSGRLTCHNAERAATRFLPASTFKIPNSLIALDSGVASGTDFPLEWDAQAVPRQPWWPEAWARDQTMRTALPNSVVWYYQELARRIGSQRMQRYLERFDYGNADISGGIDRFWLSGGLRISAEEQVRFLQRFYEGELAVSPQASDAVKPLLVLESTPEYRLSGKTGWAGFGEPGGREIGWLVGYLERAGEVYYYATNVDMRGPADAQARMKITKAALALSGLLRP